MKRTLAWLLFFAVLTFAVLFISFTSNLLPERVASHFSSSGAPNGFMSRTGYVRFMLAFAVAIPIFLVGCFAAACGLAAESINLPNRDYWLAPERRAETMDFLMLHGVWSGSLTGAFICYVHWLVLQANALQPPQLLAFGITRGIVSLAAGIAVWSGIFLSRFRRRT